MISFAMSPCEMVITKFQVQVMSMSIKISLESANCVVNG